MVNKSEWLSAIRPYQVTRVSRFLFWRLERNTVEVVRANHKKWKLAVLLLRLREQSRSWGTDCQS